MNIHIETERLVLRDIETIDAAGLFDMDSDPDVHKFLGKKPIKTLEEAQALIARIQSSYELHGIGRWAIVDKITQDFIGWTGLKYETSLRPEFDYYDLGYRLRKKYWGQGIATESAIASLKYGFEQLQLQEINACADVQHTASNHILQKIGLQWIELFEYDGEPHNWYGLTREAWLKQQ